MVEGYASFWDGAPAAPRPCPYCDGTGHALGAGPDRGNPVCEDCGGTGVFQPRPRGRCPACGRRPALVYRGWGGLCDRCGPGRLT